MAIPLLRAGILGAIRRLLQSAADSALQSPEHAVAIKVSCLGLLLRLAGFTRASHLRQSRGLGKLVLLLARSGYEVRWSAGRSAGCVMGPRLLVSVGLWVSFQVCGAKTVDHSVAHRAADTPQTPHATPSHTSLNWAAFQLLQTPSGVFRFIICFGHMHRQHSQTPCLAHGSLVHHRLCCVYLVCPLHRRNRSGRLLTLLCAL